MFVNVHEMYHAYLPWSPRPGDGSIVGLWFFENINGEANRLNFFTLFISQSHTIQQVIYNITLNVAQK